MNQRQYNESTTDFNHQVPSKHALDFIELLKETADLYKVEKVADFGTGSGHVCEALHRMNYNVWHVDLHGEVFSFAKDRYEKLGLNIRMVTPDHFFGSTERMDMISSFGVFEHIEAPFSVMNQIFEQLKNGGVVVIFADFHNFF